MRNRIVLLLIPALIVAGGLVGCADRSPTVRVTVIASWPEGAGQDTEAAAFVAVLREFERRNSHIRVDYRGTRDVSQVLRSAVDRGSPPDVAVLPRLNDLQTYVHSRKLHPLDDVLGADSDPRFVTLRGRVYGLSVNVIPKSLVWYAAHQRPTPAPATWEELVRFGTEQGRRWCLGMSAPPLSGWPGTDWIEDLFLHRWGAQTYQRWTAGGLSWDSPQMREVWQAWGQVTGKGRSAPNALLTGFNVAGLGMFAERPECHLDHQGSYIVRDYRREAPGGFDFVPFPPFAARGGTTPTTEIAEDVVGMFADTPQARELISFLAGVRARQVWRKASGGLSFTLAPGTDPAGYPDDVSRRLAATLTRGTLCRDASDLMPAAMTAAFHRAVLHHLDDPGDLDVLLRELETVRRRIPPDEWLDLPCLTR